MHRGVAVLGSILLFGAPAVAEELSDCEAIASMAYQFTHISTKCPTYKFTAFGMKLSGATFTSFEAKGCNPTELMTAQKRVLAQMYLDNPKIPEVVRANKTEARARQICESNAAYLNGASALTGGDMVVLPDLNYDPDKD